MFLLLHLLIFSNLLIWKPCVSYYRSNTQGRMRHKLRMMSKELVNDAKSKIESVQHYRQFFYKSVQYQYGNLVYEMRHRHKQMYKLYARVLDDMESNPLPVVYGEAPVNYTIRVQAYLGATIEMDHLCHEILNFATMMQAHNANLNGDKSKLGNDLFFRRLNMGPVWLGLLDSMDKNPPEPRPEEHNLTRTGKRRNGVWHYAVPIE